VAWDEISMELTVTNMEDGSPVDGLTVEVVPWMNMGNGVEHGSIETPSPPVAQKGNGKYLIETVVFSMPGTWEVRMTFSGPVSDDAAPTFDIPMP